MSSFARPSLLLAAAAACAASSLFAARDTRAGDALDALSRETQQLYKQVKSHTAVVQLPTPRWLSELAARENPLRKWGGRIDPEVARQLQEQARAAEAGGTVRVRSQLETPPAPPSTQPATDASDAGAAAPSPTDPAADKPPAPQPPPTVLVVPQPAASTRDADTAGGGATLSLAPQSALLIDAAHVIVPIYVEPETCTNAPPIRVTLPGGRVTTAKFAGSDRQTNLTLLKLDQPAAGDAATPVSFAGATPPDGAIVMLVGTGAGGASGGGNAAGAEQTARLGVWPAARLDPGAAVYATDGKLLGLARGGVFLAAEHLRPIVAQLARHGRVTRTQLGIAIFSLPADHPMRDRHPALGSRPALGIANMKPDSLAARSGLKRGDFILQLAGRDVVDLPTFSAALACHAGPTELRVLRDQQEITVTVELKPE